MDHFPHNTAARYTTKLVETLELEGAWEVCLLEIASPSSIENVSEDQCYYTIYFKPGNTSTMVIGESSGGAVQEGESVSRRFTRCSA